MSYFLRRFLPKAKFQAFSTMTYSYVRKWTGCKVYSKWESDGVSWAVEDLDPKDDDEAVNMMMTDFVNGEPMLTRLGISKDDLRFAGTEMFWADIIARRMTVACYRYSQGHREIAAINLCFVKSINDTKLTIPENSHKGIQCLINTIHYMEDLEDIHKFLDADQYLGGAGLLVLSKFRGSRLGYRILAAREALCRELGVHSTAAIFSGPASQKSAQNSGFITLFERSFADLAERGFYFPGDQSKTIKMMYVEYDADKKSKLIPKSKF